MRSYLLKEVCNIEMGQSPKGSSYNEENVGLPLLGGASDLGEVYPQAKKFTTEPSKITKKGDLILCIRATIGDRNWANREYCLGRGVAGLRPKKDVLDSRYLWHWLEVGKDQLLQQANGSTFKQVTRDAIGSYLIPLPPIAEQKRIAAILDKADAIRRKRQEAIKLTEELGRSLFLDMFGDPVTNPKSWEITTLDQVIELITYGLTVRPKYLDSGIPLISGTQIRSGVVNLETAPRISDKDYKDLSSKCKPKKGDILFAKTGSIGHCAIWNLNEDIAIAQNIARITFLPNKVKSLFALNYLRSSFIQQLAQNRAKGNAVQDLQLGEIKKFPFPLVPIKKQEVFIHTYNKKEALLIKNSVSNLESENLFNSLLQRAFKGEL